MNSSRMITFRGNSSVKKAPFNHNRVSDMASVEAVKTVEAIKCRATLSDEVLLRLFRI